LRQLGLTAEDEIKLEALRDHIVKLATARQTASKDASGQHLLGNVALQNYGVTPQTIFFNMPLAAGDDKVRSPDATRPDSAASRRQSMDTAVSTRAGSPAMGFRNFSNTSQIDDLRRRLALSAGPSTSSVHTLMGVQEARQDTRPPLPPTAELPSPSNESNLSFPSNAVSLPSDDMVRPRNRIDSRGVSVTRVSPALGQDVTPALGEINVESRYRQDDEVTSAFSTPSARPGRGIAQPQKVSTTYGKPDRLESLVLMLVEQRARM
jgi:hypothetical protein